MAEETPIRKYGVAGSHAPNDASEHASAALLLREVEDFLRDGQPRHAIAHIMDMTGVSRDLAEGFVAELQSGVFGD